MSDVDLLVRLREENSDYRKQIKELTDKIAVLKQQKAELSAELEHLKSEKEIKIK